MDSVGDLEEDELSFLGSIWLLHSEEEATDPRVKEEVGSTFSIALRYVTRVMNIGLSVCGNLFYLLIFWYTNKQLESHTLTGSCVSSCV